MPDILQCRDHSLGCSGTRLKATTCNHFITGKHLGRRSAGRTVGAGEGFVRRSLKWFRPSAALRILPRCSFFRRLPGGKVCKDYYARIARPFANPCSGLRAARVGETSDSL